MHGNNYTRTSSAFCKGDYAVKLILPYGREMADQKEETQLQSKEALTIVFMNSIRKETWRGGEKWMVNAAAGLKERGHRVICIGKNDAVWLQKARLRGLETLEMNIHADFDPVIITRLYFFFKKIKPSVICLNFEKDVRLGGIAAKLAGIKTIFVRKGLSLLYEKMRYRLAYKYIVKDIISPAYYIKKYFERFDWVKQDAIHVIHNGVEIPDVGSYDQQKIIKVDSYISRPVLFAAGSMFWQKGFEYLIEALRILHDENLKAHLVIAGEGDPEPYKKLTADLNLVSYVHFAGIRNDVTELMYSADLFVLSSVDEGLPNVVLEAMSVGVPVVATDAGGTNEIVVDGECGYIVPVKDHKALASRIKDLLTDETKRKQFGDMGLERVKKMFTIDAMVRSVEELFIQKCREHCQSPR